MLLSRLYVLLFLSFVGAFVAPSSFAAESPLWRLSSKPQWVKDAVLSADSREGQGIESMEVLLSDTQVSLLNQDVHYYRHLRIQLNDKVGVDENSDIYIGFNPEFQHLELHHIEIIRDGQAENRLYPEDVRIVDIEPEQHNKLYSGQKQLQLWLRDIRAGDIVDYSFSVVGENPVFGQHFSHTFSLGWNVPVKQVEVSIISPKSQPLHNQINRLELQPKQHSEQQRVRYSLSLSDVPAYFDDGENPSWQNISPSWQVSSFDSWGAVAQWAEQLFQPAHTPSAAFQQWLAELQKQPTKLAIEEAIRFVQQDIRYLGVEIGQNSHRPQAPSAVLSNRYGDCKDKSLLLVKALNALDVEAYPVLVSSYLRDTLSEHLPSYNAFNHAIVLLRYRQQDYWIDPTNAYQASLLESIVPAAFGQALVVKPSTQELVAIPELTAADNTLSVEQVFIASDFRSPVQFKVSSVFTGLEADRMRYQLANQSQQRLAKSSVDYYQRFYPSLSRLGDMEVNDDVISNRLQISEQYLVKNFWEQQEQTVFHLIANSVEHYLKVPKKLNRQQAYLLGPLVSVQQNITLQLPYDIDFTSLNQQQELQDDYFKWQSRFDYQNRLIRYQQSYQNKAIAVKAEDVKDYAKLIRQARKHLEFAYSIDHAAEDKAYDSMAKLVNYLLDKKQAQQGEWQ
ncbi:DUF3857 domain-containing transglutaminase family protein [Agarivorans sp.]|uniref:DUF3857 domain-containing transglutaminase family protein n=1 Tax=Agarivorans sp. TaxID=1872412 RepID=UPI003CFFF7ED